MLYHCSGFAKLLLVTSPFLFLSDDWKEVLFSSGAYFHSCGGEGKCLRSVLTPNLDEVKMI